MTRSITYTAVFQANSLNYGEGIANVSELKKLHRDNGEVFSYASRQSLRYDVVRLGNELFGWNLDTVEKQSGSVVQFKKNVTIRDSVEMDLFGYLKTDKVSEKRPAVARLSHAISLEAYRSDLEFLNNMGLASRIPSDPNLANIEQHYSFYSYTLTIDLNRVGIDSNSNIELPSSERAKRVTELLEVMKILYRDIRGRRENLSPLFIVGGAYQVSNPFFMGRVAVRPATNGWEIDARQLASVMSTTFMGESIAPATRIGLIDGIWANEAKLREQFAGQVGSVDEFFAHLAAAVRSYYGG